MHLSESRTLANLAKPKLMMWLVNDERQYDGVMRHDIPFASSSGGVNDGLALLDLAEAGSITQKQLIVSGGMKATDVNVAIALDAILQALLDRLGMSRRSEDGGNRLGDGWILLQERQQLLIDDRGGLGNAARGHDLLRGGSVEAGANHSNAAITTTVGESAEERSSRGGLVGGVRAPTVLEPRSLAAALTVRGDTARRVRHRMIRNRQRSVSSLNRILSSNANLVGRLGRDADMHGDRISLVGDLLVLHVVLMTSLALRDSRVTRTRGQSEAAELIHDGAHVVGAMVGLMTMGDRAIMLSIANLGRKVALIAALAIGAGVGDDSRVGAILDGHLGWLG